MLLSARTVKYIEALNREGDRFIYRKWLQSVREEEATQAEHVTPLISSREPTPPEIDNLIDMPDRRSALMLPEPGVVTKPATVPRSLRRINHESSRLSISGGVGSREQMRGVTCSASVATYSRTLLSHIR